MKPDFFHVKSHINNDGCSCCQRNSLSNLKKIRNRARRRLDKKEAQNSED